MKSHKRYTSEEQILKKIDALRAELAALPAKIGELESDCKRHKHRMDEGLSSPDEYDQHKEALALLDRLKRRMKTIPEVQLPALGKKLSIFRTELLPGCGEDRSIAVR